jgi:hypothetical protein
MLFLSHRAQLRQSAGSLILLRRSRWFEDLCRVLAMSSDCCEGVNIVAVFRQILAESTAVELKTAVGEDRATKSLPVGPKA